MMKCIKTVYVHKMHTFIRYVYSGLDEPVELSKKKWKTESRFLTEEGISLPLLPDRV